LCSRCGEPCGEPWREARSPLHLDHLHRWSSRSQPYRSVQVRHTHSITTTHYCGSMHPSHSLALCHKHPFPLDTPFSRY
jgi:hypothetical protein